LSGKVGGVAAALTTDIVKLTLEGVNMRWGDPLMGRIELYVLLGLAAAM
jgi:hypothetical protein